MKLRIKIPALTIIMLTRSKRYNILLYYSTENDVKYGETRKKPLSNNIEHKL